MTEGRNIALEMPSSIAELSSRLNSLGIAIQPKTDPQTSNRISFCIERIDRDRVRAAAISAGMKALRIESRVNDPFGESVIAREEGGLQLFEVSIRWRDAPPPALEEMRQAELSSGGICIAISGGDGAGKSTAIGMLSKWLASTFAVQRFHIGRPDPLFISSILYRTLGVLRRVGLVIPDPMAISVRGGGAFGFWERLALGLQLLCQARDRRRSHEASRREVGMGRIVLCDRYPDSRISDMEGPRMQLLWPNPTRLQNRLLQFERHCYQGFAKPDVHIILRVSPEVARLRQPKDDPEALRRRVEAVARACDEAPDDVIVVDADASIEIVHEELRRIVWNAL